MLGSKFIYVGKRGTLSSAGCSDLNIMREYWDNDLNNRHQAYDIKYIPVIYISLSISRK